MKQKFLLLITLNFIFGSDNTKTYNIIHLPTYENPIEMKTQYVFMLTDIYQFKFQELFEETIAKISKEFNKKKVTYLEVLRCNTFLFVNYFIELLKLNNYEYLSQLLELFEFSRNTQTRNDVLTNNDKVFYLFNEILKNLVPDEYSKIENKKFITNKLRQNLLSINDLEVNLCKLIIQFIVNNLDGYKLLYSVYPHLKSIYKVINTQSWNKTKDITIILNQVSNNSMSIDITKIDTLCNKMEQFLLEMKSKKYNHIEVNFKITTHEVFFLLVIRSVDDIKKFDKNTFVRKWNEYFSTMEEFIEKYKELFHLYIPYSLNLKINLKSEYFEKTYFDHLNYFFSKLINSDEILQVLGKSYNYFRFLARKTNKRLEEIDNKLQHLRLNYINDNYKLNEPKQKKQDSNLENILIFKYIKFLRKSKGLKHYD